MAVAADVDSHVLREGKDKAGSGGTFLSLLLGLPLLLSSFYRGTRQVLLLGGGSERGSRKGGGGRGHAVTASFVDKSGDAVGQVHALRLVLHAKVYPNG